MEDKGDAVSHSLAVPKNLNPLAALESRKRLAAKSLNRAPRTIRNKKAVSMTSVLLFLLDPVGNLPLRNDINGRSLRDLGFS